MNTIPQNDFDAELQKILDDASDYTLADQQTLEAASKALHNDQEFQADVLKGEFVIAIKEAMTDEGLEQTTLADKWGKTRQYLSKILNEDKRVNFTIETMVSLAMTLNRRLRISVEKEFSVSGVEEIACSIINFVPKFSRSGFPNEGVLFDVQSNKFKTNLNDAYQKKPAC